MAANPFNTADLTDINLSGNGADDAYTSDFNGKHTRPAEPSGPAGIQPMQIESAPDDNGTATWPQAAYHTMTAVIGAGVLGLPFAFSYLGWAVGVLFLVLCAAASSYTGWQLSSMHELGGKRIGRYRDLGVHVLGPLWGRVAVVPFQFLVMVGLGIVYTVTGAKSMQIIEVLAAGKEDEDVALTKYIFIFGLVQLGLSQIKDFAALWWVSIVGALMALLYSAMAGILAIAAGTSDGHAPDYGRRDDGQKFWRGVFTSMGAITFAYAGQSVFLEIQATLRVPPPAKESMLKGIYTAYIVANICYVFVAGAGYGSYGNIVNEDVLLSKPRVGVAWIAIANLMVWLHVVASFQVFTQPVFEALESSLCKRYYKLDNNRLWLRLVWRSFYVIIATLIAATLPFFADLMGLIGALGFIPMTFVMPCVLYLKSHPGELTLMQRIANWFIIVFFSLVGLVALVASAATIATKKSSGQFDIWSGGGKQIASPSPDDAAAGGA